LARLRETRRGHHAAVLDADMLLPMAGQMIADVGGSVIGFALHTLIWRRHAPQWIRNSALIIRSVADHRAKAAGIDGNRWLKVA
jgi:hypothetical protein